jgi:hypothetical protein
MITYFTACGQLPSNRQPEFPALPYTTRTALGAGKDALVKLSAKLTISVLPEPLAASVAPLTVHWLFC